jgi:AcrR family transcriptional regulator
MPPIPELEAIRRTQILEAAIVTISENGQANVTMDDIARAANLSKGGLAHYYPSKNRLFKAVISEFYRRIFERGRTVMEEFEDPIDQILSFAGWLYNREDPDGIVGYPIIFDFMSVAVHDEDYREIFNDWVDNWVFLLTSALNEAIERNILRDLNVDEMARAISAVYQGLSTRWYLASAKHSTDWARKYLEKAVTGMLAPYLMQPPKNT